jgi:phosphotransferase system HPr-like phosphotransfer protein
MPQRQKYPLRALSQQEERELRRIEKASSERVDVVRRAKALLAVAASQTFSQAAEARSVSHLVELLVAPGRGCKLTYTSEQQARILQEVQRVPDRQEDQTAIWSLSTLRRALRKTALPHIANETVRQVLHASGYS